MSLLFILKINYIYNYTSFTYFPTKPFVYFDFWLIFCILEV